MFLKYYTDKKKYYKQHFVDCILELKAHGTLRRQELSLEKSNKRKSTQAKKV